MRWVVLALFAVLPVQWMAAPIGGARAHVVGMMVAAGTALACCTWARFRDVLGVCWPFVAAMGVLVVLWIATDVFHRDPLRDGVQQLMLLAMFVGLSAAMLVAVRDPRGTHALRWSGVVCNLTLLAALGISMAVNAIDPAEVVSETLATGDPEVLQRRVFKDALVGFGLDSETLLSNVRHEILAAVLVAAYVSVVAARLAPFRDPLALAIFRVSLALSLVLVVCSLSRAVLLAALAWPALALLRSWQRQRFDGAQVTAGFLAAGGVLVAVFVGVAGVIWTRFADDTTSYEARENLLGQALADIGTHVLTGGVATRGQSSHNFVLDSWLRTGLAGAGAALVVTLLLVGLLTTLVVRIGREPEWMVPVAAALTLVVVRMFTAGGGTIPPVEWVALAFVAAMMAHRHDLLHRVDVANAPRHRAEPIGAAG